MSASALLHRHSANLTGRDFVVGDLHGCVDALRALLHEVRFDPARDRLFSVGDLVDRGPASETALELLDRPWCHVVRGNHEEVLSLVARGKLPADAWRGIGGDWGADLPPERLRAYAARVDALPLVRVIGEGATRFNVLHAEFFGSDADLDTGDYPPDVRERLIWGRDLVQGLVDPGWQAGLSLTCSGHTPVRAPQRIGAQWFIDTGAFAPAGRLTLAEPRTGQTWSITQAAARERGAAAWPLP
ncbi:metallophosphoesterase [Burkholderia multivorans]|uniref:metallophosphoesterase n=1 Tax=Burkholderia multivorans TaxID=87883 RepID=UPI0008413C41|nr:metallophosphoesterase [Burkholderia multivorans]AOJ96087.1 metallophosphoesterase [Burkholderia multivorans]MBH9660451.1 metallophosphoesterase [Burkholderia multivorans]MBU9240748.1 metallophosphoesterase [Burkholderia multivorans]MCO1340714.1 metallophosphoesterase [Burkholderia multivorans]MCO1440110.1 metallophosphoesterase [Burkholderia multivorans]